MCTEGKFVNQRKWFCCEEDTTNADFRYIGKGSYGTVYRKKSMGSPVYKVIRLKDQDDLEDFIAEVGMSAKMADIGVGPAIYDSYISEQNGEDVGVIVMESMDMDLGGYIKHLRHEDRLNDYELGLVGRKVFNLFMSQAVKNIVTTDLKPENIVISMDDDERIQEALAIDFDVSFILSAPIYELNQVELAYAMANMLRAEAMVHHNVDVFPSLEKGRYIDLPMSIDYYKASAVLIANSDRMWNMLVHYTHNGVKDANGNKDSGYARDVITKISEGKAGFSMN